MSLAEFVVSLSSLMNIELPQDPSASLDLDSLGLLVMLVVLEEEFGVDIPPGMLGEFDTVGDVYEHYLFRLDQRRDSGELAQS